MKKPTKPTLVVSENKVLDQGETAKLLVTEEEQTVPEIVAEASQKQSSLLSNNVQFKSFVDAIDYGVIVGSKDGYIVDFNQAALEIFGYEDSDLRGQPITKIMPQRFRDAHNSGMSRYNKTKKPRNLGKTLRLYGLNKAGKEFPLEIALSSWKDADGEQYFTASIRKYSQLENNLGYILMMAGVIAAVMLVTLIILAMRSF